MLDSQTDRGTAKGGEVGMRELIIAVPDHFGKTLEPEKMTTMIQGELVRCRDCVHAEPERVEEEIWCPVTCSLRSMDWFCADGERKEGM